MPFLFPDAKFWIDGAQKLLTAKLKFCPKLCKAKNVIFFLGDGLSIPTLAATRVFIGGEEKVLSFEEFPFTGLSRVSDAHISRNINWTTVR